MRQEESVQETSSNPHAAQKRNVAESSYDGKKIRNWVDMQETKGRSSLSSRYSEKKNHRWKRIWEGCGTEGPRIWERGGERSLCQFPVKRGHSGGGHRCGKHTKERICSLHIRVGRKMQVLRQEDNGIGERFQEKLNILEEGGGGFTG